MASRVHVQGKMVRGVALLDYVLAEEEERGCSKKSCSKFCIGHFITSLQMDRTKWYCKERGRPGERGGAVEVRVGFGKDQMGF
jgi:hypothetical protein